MSERSEPPAGPKSDARTPIFPAPSRASSCGIAENIPTIPDPSGNETGLVTSASELTRGPITGMPAAPRIGHTRSESTALMPTTATTPRVTARRAHISARAGSSLVLHTTTSISRRLSAPSTMPPRNGALFNRALTAPAHERLLLKSPMVMTVTAAPSGSAARATGVAAPAARAINGARAAAAIHLGPRSLRGRGLRARDMRSDG